MNPFESLLQALSSIGQGTPESAQGIQQEQGADQQLNQQNSVMGSERQGQLLGQQSPFEATLNQLLSFFNPGNIGGPAGGGVQAMAGLAGRTGKVFKEAAPVAENTIESLIKALASGEASIPGRASLRPALKNLTTGELMNGSVGSGHGPLYEAVPPSWARVGQNAVQHGFLHPEGQFLTQSLIDTLNQPKQVTALNKLLGKGTSLQDALAGIPSF